MGHFTEFDVMTGNSKEEAFQSFVDEYRDEYGRMGETGTFADARSFVSPPNPIRRLYRDGLTLFELPYLVNPVSYEPCQVFNLIDSNTLGANVVEKTVVVDHAEKVENDDVVRNFMKSNPELVVVGYDFDDVSRKCQVTKSVTDMVYRVVEVVNGREATYGAKDFETRTEANKFAREKAASGKTVKVTPLKSTVFEPVDFVQTLKFTFRTRRILKSTKIVPGSWLIAGSFHR